MKTPSLVFALSVGLSLPAVCDAATIRVPADAATIQQAIDAAAGAVDVTVRGRSVRVATRRDEDLIVATAEWPSGEGGAA